MPRWIKVAGSLDSISVGGAGLLPGGKTAARTDQIIWGTNSQHKIFVRGFDRDRLGQWQMVPGALTQVAVGPKADNSGACPVWGVNSKQQIFQLKKGRTGDPAWQNIPGSLKQIAVGPYGVWGVNNDNHVLELKTTGYQPSWTAHSGSLSSIAVGTDEVWGASPKGQVYRGVKSQGKMDWTLIPGSLSQVTVSGTLVCGVNEKGGVFYKHESLPWSELPPPPAVKFRQCATNGWSVWAIDTSGGVWLWGD